MVGERPQPFEVVVRLGDKRGNYGEVPEDEHGYFGKQCFAKHLVENHSSKLDRKIRPEEGRKEILALLGKNGLESCGCSRNRK